MSMKPALDRVLSKVRISTHNSYQNSPCWEWQGSLSIKGYGNIRINNTCVRVHRFIYEYYYGSICPDLQINHKCKNKSCCNPIHLEQVTAQQNNEYSKPEYLEGLKRRIHRNTQKTHCIRGHEFTSENTYVAKNNTRHCKTCKRTPLLN